MQRAWFGVILCVVALFGLPQGSVSAQEIPTPVGWEMGLVYADGASEDNPFTLEEDETTIRFWVRNDNLAGDIHVGFAYDSSSDAILEGETHTTVGSGSNDTFTLKFTKPSNGLFDLWSIPAGTIYDFEIYGELSSVGPGHDWFHAPAQIRPSQTIDGEVVVPELHRWEVDITEIEHTVSAGTEFNLQVDFRNIGNTADKLQSATIEDDCPVLTSDDDFGDGLTGTLTQPSEAISSTIVFDASSTHPTRLCEIEITVRSTGVANGGLGDSSNRGETVVNVEARPVGAQVDQDQADVGDNDGPQNQEEVTRDNFLMFPSLLTPLAIVSAAWVQSRRN